MDFATASAIAHQYVSELEDEICVPLKLVELATIERSFGWVFFYAADPGRTKDELAGNGPIIIDRKSGTLLECGSAQHPDVYIEEYERLQRNK